MAEQSKDLQDDSMENILQSIKQIISTESGEGNVSEKAEAAKTGTANTNTGTDAPKNEETSMKKEDAENKEDNAKDASESPDNQEKTAEVGSGGGDAEAASEDEVLELTDKVQEPGEESDNKPGAESSEIPESAKPTAESEEGGDPVKEAAKDVLENIDEALQEEDPGADNADLAKKTAENQEVSSADSEASEKAPEKDPEKDENLISQEASKDSAQSLKELTDSIPKPKIDSPTISPDKTLEDLVIQSIKPMLSDWLNKNLPTLVKQIVEKEIRKIIPKD